MRRDRVLRGRCSIRVIALFSLSAVVAVAVPPAGATRGLGPVVAAGRGDAVSAPRLFAANLFVQMIASHVLERDGDAISVGVVDGVGDPYGAVRQIGSIDTPLSPDTPFRIASISKTLTAVAVLRLVDQGLLALDDRPIPALFERRGLSCSTSRVSEIQVRDLLAHTSGFDSGREWFFDEVVADSRELVGRFCAHELRAAPGTKSRYSNFNYLLLGWLIEDLTGLAYAEAVESSILEPNGLTSFQFRYSSVRQSGEPGYYVDPGSNYMELLGAAGAWSASSTDLARFARTLLLSEVGQGVLSPAMWESMKSPARLVTGGRVWDYGLGLRLFGAGSWGHTGSIESIKALMIVFPDGGTVAVLIDGEQPERTDDLIGIVSEAWWMCHHSGFLLAVPAT